MGSSADPLPARDLAAFVAAVEAGSVQGAADALVLTQSAATKRIQSLERRLDAVLLERGRYGTRLTEAGRTLYPDAKEALAALHRGEQRVRAIGGRQALALRVAASHTIGSFLLPHWLSAFRAVAPLVQTQVEVVNSPTVLRLLRGGEVAIGFVEGTDDLSGLDRLVVGVDELAVVVAAGHRWARRSSLRAAELVDEPYFVREAGSGTRAVAEQRIAERGTVLQPSLEVASAESLKRSIIDGGFVVMSRHAVATEVAAGALVALPVADVDLRRELVAVRLGGRRQARAPSEMWRWLERRVGDPGTGGSTDRPPASL